MLQASPFKKPLLLAAFCYLDIFKSFPITPSQITPQSAGGVRFESRLVRYVPTAEFVV